MAFELRTSISDYTNTRFPTPDLEGAMDRRKRREQMDKQLQQQKELNDLARAEKIREFNARGVQAFGADAVVTPDGTVDYQASAANQQKRQDAALMDQARGLRTAIQPPMVDMTKGEAGFTPEMLGALGLSNSLPGEVNLEGKSPQFQAAYTKGIAEKARQDFELNKANAALLGRARNTSLSTQERNALKQRDFLLANDPTSDAEALNIYDENGVFSPDRADVVAERYSGIAPKLNAAKGLSASQRWLTTPEELKNELAAPGTPERERLDRNAISAAERRAEAFAKEIEGASGRKLTERELSEVRAKALAGVQSMNAPTQILKDVTTEADNLRQISSVSDRINAFNAKYGEKAFDKFVGPIEGRATKLKAQIIPTEKRAEATSEAKQIFQQVELIAQAFRKPNFGTALTAPEIQSFQQILSNPTFADYTDSIANFGNILRQRVGEQIQDYKLAPNIPTRIKDQFMPQEANPKGADFRQDPDSQEPALQGSGLSPEARRARIAELRSKLGGNQVK